MNIAFFDFDGTITKRDSLIEFIKFSVGVKRFFLGLFVLSPMLIVYKLKLIPNYQAKQILFSYFFKDFDEDEFKNIAVDFSLNYIDKIVRKSALDRIKWHKQKGHKVVIVSASLECWLKPWCNKYDLELISTKLEIENGKITGNFSTNNCYGKEKVRRIMKEYNLDKYDFIYVYGDSKGDIEMLKLANEAYYKYFKE